MKIKKTLKMAKKNYPSSTNFETKTNELTGKKTIIGFDANYVKSFLSNCANAAFDGKHYKLAMIEADASPAQRGFLFVVYRSVLEYLKWEITEKNMLRIRATFEDTFLSLAKSHDNDLYDCDYWIIATVDLETGELKNERLRPASSWSIGHKSEFLAFLESTTTATWIDYKFPSPKDFKGEVKGERSTVQNQHLFYDL